MTLVLTLTFFLGMPTHEARFDAKFGQGGKQVLFFVRVSGGLIACNSLQGNLRRVEIVTAQRCRGCLHVIQLPMTRKKEGVVVLIMALQCHAAFLGEWIIQDTSITGAWQIRFQSSL